MRQDILDKVSAAHDAFSDAYDDMHAYDEIYNMEWEGIEGLVGKPGAVMFTDPLGHDLVTQATNIFDTHNPKWDVIPRGPNDSDNAARYEAWLTWHFAQANKHGASEPFGAMFRHVNLYNRVAAQLEFHKEKGYEYCPFQIIVHDPKAVCYEMGRSGPIWVSVVDNILARDVKSHWHGYEKDKDVSKALKKIQDLIDDDDEARLIYIDYTDNDIRYVVCWLTSDETVPETFGDEQPDDVIVIVDKDNKKGFVNWAISVGTNDPLLYTLHKGGLWKNINQSETIKRFTAYRRAIYPLGIETGVGEDIVVDFTADGDSTIKVPPGKQFQPTIPPPLDPAFNELSAQDRGLASRSVGLENLSGIQSASNVQFATINALIQLRLSQLEDNKRCFERAGEQLARIMFRYMNESDDMVVGYVAEDRDGMKRGEEIGFDKDAFARMENLFANCILLPNNPTDKLQRMNMITMAKQAGLPIPDDEMLEGMGYGAPEALKERWEKQVIEMAVLEAIKLGIVEGERMKLQMQAQAAQMQMQQQMQQQQMAQMQGAQSPDQGAPAFDATSGQGFNAGQGGQAPMAQGGMTRGVVEGDTGSGPMQ
jgi:hypothetical protein